VSNPNFIQITQQAEAALPLRNEGCRSRFWLHPTPTKKVFLFFHGITAAPYQFDTLGEALFLAGHNVIVPLLPGHGVAGDWDAANPPPLPEDMQVYQDFVMEWLGHAQSMGTAVVVGGLSAGGTLAAWVAIERPEMIERAILFAPYLSNASLITDLITNSSEGYFAWQENRSFERVGYKGFRFPALHIFPALGRQLLQQAERATTAPMFILSTETDVAVDNDDHKGLFLATRSRQPLSWYYCFPRALGIPHAMLAPEEGNQWTSAMNVMVKAYASSRLSWSEIEEIAVRMGDGRTYDDVVGEMGLGGRSSADMPAMLTMVDKRQIAIERNPSGDWS
jgi:pimeloyl-ACP methyl ester carboxylesterase